MEPVWFPGALIAPRESRSLEETVGSDDVGVDECIRSRDGSIDMTLCCQVDDRVKLFVTQEGFDEFCIANVTVNEVEAFIVEEIGDALQVPSVGEGVDDNDAVVGMALQPVPNEVRADEARSAGYE